jgi:SAM-dependent methyltransferase
VGQVVAIDPEPEMLRIAQEEAGRAGRAIDFRQGSSSELGPDLGHFRLVTIGRAFHWMDRPDTLRRLDQLVDPDGAVVLFGDDHPAVPDNRWLAAFEQLIDRYAAINPVGARHQSADWVRHEASLLDSPFACLERLGVIERRQTPLEHFVDRALSLSIVSRDRIGARADDLADEVRGVMAPFAVTGTVVEVVESQALLARRQAATRANV